MLLTTRRTLGGVCAKALNPGTTPENIVAAPTAPAAFRIVLLVVILASLGSSVVSDAHASLAVRERDADVLHHSLVLVVEDVAVQDVGADVALVARTHDQRVLPGRLAPEVLQPQRVLPDALQARVLRIHGAARVVDRARPARVLAARVQEPTDTARAD